MSLDLAARLLRALPAEAAHRATLRLTGLFAPLLPKAPSDDRRLGVKALGLNFPNPIGLAAGFDKDAEVPDAMLKLGFTLLGEGEEAAGMGVLESLTRAFPKHEASRLAIARLAHPEAEVSVAGAAGAPPGASAGVKGGPTLGTIVPPAPGALGGSR